MSLRYRDSSGNETIVSGLTPGGDIEAGAVTTRTGTATVPANSSSTYSDVTVTFDTPMPDNDYIVDIKPLNGGFEYVVWFVGSKTINGFLLRTYGLNGSRVNYSSTYSYTAYKVYTVQHAAQNAEDIANIKATIPSTASSTNKLATSNDVTTLATDTDGRLDDLEDLVPTGASVSNQLATKDNIDTVTANANSRLKVVNVIPSTPADGDVILYTGTEASYRKGGIYQYAATPGTWVLISTADVDLSHYETSFTGTTAEWNALSSIEKDKYDLVNLTDDNEREIGENFSTNEQRVGSWIDGKPIYKITFTMSNPASSTAPSTHAEITVTKNVASLHIDKIVKWDAVCSWPPSTGSNVEGYYFPTDITTTSDIASSVSGSSAVGAPNNYTRQYFYRNGNYIGLSKNGRYYNYGVTVYNTIYYTKTTD